MRRYGLLTRTGMLSDRRGFVRRPCCRSGASAGLAAGVLLAASGTLWAQPADEIRRVVTQLGAERFSDREAASERLTELSISLESIRLARIALDSLSPEHRTRLDAALFDSFRNSPRAGMGVSFDAQFALGVRLQSIVPGFPASGVLLPGDIILQADGVRLTGVGQQGWQSLRQRILSHDPGDSIPMVIRRGDRTVELDAPLGDYADLGNAASLSAEDMFAAWSIRRQSLGLELRDPVRIPAPTAETAWIPLTQHDRALAGPDLGLIAGGVPGSRPTLRLDQIAQAANSPRLSGNRASIRMVNPAGRPNVVVQPAIAAQDHRLLITRQLDQWRNILQDAKARASDPAIDERERSRAAVQVLRSEEQILMLQRRLSELRPKP